MVLLSLLHHEIPPQAVEHHSVRNGIAWKKKSNKKFSLFFPKKIKIKLASLKDSSKNGKTFFWSLLKENSH